MKKIATYLLTLAVAVSCNLHLEPTDAIVYEEGGKVIATTEELVGFEAGILSNYRAVHGGMYATIEELMLDGFNASSGFGNNYGSVHRTDDSYTSSDGYIESYWTNHYVVIKNYNVFIDALADKINIPEGYEDVARFFQGEAYFFRAEAYLNLVRHFGPDFDPADTQALGVPLVLHYDLNELPARKTVHEVYTQIKADLDSAAVRFADATLNRGDDYPSPTVLNDALNALYARYYLDIEDFENAAAKAEEVIKTKRYSLSKSVSALKSEFVDDSGTEAIMMLYGNMNSELPNGISVYTNMFSSKDNGICSRAMFLPTKKLVDSYSSSDIRRQSWFSSTDFYTEVNGAYYRGNFYTFVKYMGNPALYTTIPNGVQKAKPYLISEMYLIQAEALARSGRTLAARTVLQELQTARNATKTGGSVEDVQAEWFRETVGEGFRLSCLKRWGKGFDGREGQTGALSVNAIMTGTYYDGRTIGDNEMYLLTWPIPAGQIKLNRNLEQNPGYSIQ